jgi:polyhydroxybutyrate depolymerase
VTLILIVAALLLAWVSPAAAQLVTFPVGGEMRQAFVYAPSAPHGAGAVRTPPSPPAGAKLPLVFAFHGRGDTIRDFQYVNLHVAWRDAIVVYFQALDRDGLSGWQVERGQDGDRDLKLIDAALASLRKKYAVDDDRIYATGFSNGAAFTYLLWAERPAVFAAYAVVAGRLRPAVRLTEPRPLFAVAGERDPQIPFADQKAAIDAATALNAARAPVETWIHPGGHSFPRGTSERIVAFFKDHTRKR